MNIIAAKCLQRSHLPGQNDRLLEELCTAARNNDASAVAKSLSLRRRSSPSIHSPLLHSANIASIDLEDLLSKDSIHQIIKALLMAPSAYDTPWLAALQLLSIPQNLGNNNLSRGKPELVRIISFEIQTFIQQNVASWLDEERKNSLSDTSVPRQVRPTGPEESLSALRPSDWMIQLADCTMKPLFKENQSEQSNEKASILEMCRWEPTLGIISSLVVLTEHLDTKLYHSILDVVISPTRLSCLLPFLRLILDVRSHLREKDWSFLLHHLESCLEESSCYESGNDLPLIMEIILKLITTWLGKVDTSSFTSSWRRIILQIMRLASENALTFDCVESAISKYVSSLSAVTQRRLMFSLRKDDYQEDVKYPCWLKACMLLQLADASSRSKSELVSHMLIRSLPPTSRLKIAPDATIHNPLIQDIFDLAERGHGPWSVHLGNVNEADNKKYRNAIFRSLDYNGKGQFVGANSSRAALLNRIGSLVWETLTVGRSKSPNNAETRRIDSWIKCSFFVLSTYHSSHRDVMMALATLTTIFCELPAQQSKLKELLLNSFAQLDCCDEKTTDLAVLYCLILSKLSRCDSISQYTAIQGVESIVATPMTLSLFMDAVNAIADLPCGREKLLCISRSHIDSLSSLNADESFSTMMSPSNLMKCGLHGLVSLVSVPVWTDLEEEAWVLLSNFIVHDQPRYTVTHRIWLYEHVRQRVLSQSISSLSAEHFLRCCIARLLVFYDISADNMLCFVPERVYHFSMVNADELVRNEDTVGLIGLTMDLMHLLLAERGQVDVRKTVGVAYHHLLREIDSKGTNTNPGNIFSSLLLAVDDGQASIFAVSIACLVAIVLEKPLIMPCPSSDISCLSIQDLKRRNADEERLSLKYPCSIKWDEFAISSTSNKNVAPEIKEAAISLRIQATDVLLDFIFDPRWKVARVSSQSEILVKRLSTILAVKRQWKLEARTKSFERPTMHCERVINTCNYLLSVLLPSIDEIIQFDCTLGDMDSVFSIVLDICELLQDSFEFVFDGRLRSLCLDNIRSLYFSLCSECKCSELVLQIEKILTTKTTMHEHRQQLFCLNSVKHEDDIDDFVRYLRSSILGVIISSLQPSHKGTLYAAGIPTASITSHHSTTIFSLLASLCEDMLFGLEGKSGGLTYELFDSMLDAAKTLINQLQSMEESFTITGKKFSTRVFDLNGATNLFEEILQTTTFTQRIAHKKLFSLAAEKLPSLNRFILRKLLCGEPVMLMIDPLLNKGAILAAKAFMQALDVHQGYSGGEQSMWREESLRDLEDDCSTCSGKPRVYCSKKRTEHIDKSSPDRRTTHADCLIPPKQEVVQIHDNKSWLWTLSSSLQAIAAFMEDFRASLHVKKQVAPGSILKHYTAARTAEMDGIFSALNFVLDTTDKDIKEIGDTHSVRAMLLTPIIQGKICCVLDSMFSALTKSLKIIQDLTRHILGEIEYEMSVAAVEALSYLISWLSFRPSDTLDIFHKVRCWRQLEIRQSNEHAKRSGLTSSDTLIAIKLRKTEILMDESEGTLQKVLQGMQTSRDKRSSHQDKFLSALDKCIDCNLVELLSNKSSQLLEGHVLIENQFGQADSEEGTKKRKITENMKRRLNKERRRRTLRSRNGVVDKWLQIDRVTGDEIVEDDVFADLEDFLVDG